MRHVLATFSLVVWIAGCGGGSGGSDTDVANDFSTLQYAADFRAEGYTTPDDLVAYQTVASQTGSVTYQGVAEYREHLNSGGPTYDVLDYLAVGSFTATIDFAANDDPITGEARDFVEIANFDDYDDNVNAGTIENIQSSGEINGSFFVTGNFGALGTTDPDATLVNGEVNGTIVKINGDGESMTNIPMFNGQFFGTEGETFVWTSTQDIRESRSRQILFIATDPDAGP